MENKLTILSTGLILSMGLIFVGCPLSKNPPPQEIKKTAPKIDTSKFNTFELPDGAPSPVLIKSGLSYIDFVKGKGDSPETGQQVMVHYTGWLADGRKFDSSIDRGQPFSFAIGVGQVIKGWEEGVSTMRVGGIRRLIIPPQLGYGERGAGDIIPPNSTLHFNVELLAIK